MDHHDRFREWLLAGARGEPARDMALHASTCPGCLADVAALDGLLAVNVAGAEVPAVPAGTYVAPRSSTIRILRAISGVTAVGLLVMAAMIGAGSLRDREGGPGIGAAPTQTPIGEGVLGGAAGPTTSASPDAGSTSPSADATAAPDESLESGGPPAGPTGTLPPFVAPPPPPVTPGLTPTPGVVTPQPTAAPPTAVPTTAPPPTPDPTEQPSATPAPTEIPTPTPTPTPTPPPTPSVEPPPPGESPAP